MWTVNCLDGMKLFYSNNPDNEVRGLKLQKKLKYSFAVITRKGQFILRLEHHHRL